MLLSDACRQKSVLESGIFFRSLGLWIVSADFPRLKLHLTNVWYMEASIVTRCVRPASGILPVISLLRIVVSVLLVVRCTIQDCLLARHCILMLVWYVESRHIVWFTKCSQVVMCSQTSVVHQTELMFPIAAACQRNLTRTCTALHMIERCKHD